MAAPSRCFKNRSRLWKSVKYEDVYLKAYTSLGEVRKGLTLWFDRYTTRRHQGLDNRTPDEVYWSALPGMEHAV
jgi:putative transposase